MNLHQKSAVRGFTLIEFLFVVAALAVLTAIFLPQLARHKSRAHPPNCVNNLKQVGLAFRQWALDHNDKNPPQVPVTNGGTMELVESGNVFPHFMVMSKELNTPMVLACREDKTRTATRGGFTANFTDANVSYFVGLDAVDTMPQMFLAGDDNMAVRGVRVRRGILSLWTNTPVTWTKERHVNQGNVALADGSVQGFSTAKLREALCGTGDLTNRLAFP